jgi:hypothetical protein
MVRFVPCTVLIRPARGCCRAQVKQENDTPAVAAQQLRVKVQQLLGVNKTWYPGISTNVRLKQGTLLQIPDTPGARCGTVPHGLGQILHGHDSVSRAFASWNRSILTEISLCHACSCHQILRAETAGQKPADESDDEWGFTRRVKPPQATASAAAGCRRRAVSAQVYSHGEQLPVSALGGRAALLAQPFSVAEARGWLRRLGRTGGLQLRPCTEATAPHVEAVSWVGGAAPASCDGWVKWVKWVKWVEWVEWWCHTPAAARRPCSESSLTCAPLVSCCWGRARRRRRPRTCCRAPTGPLVARSRSAAPRRGCACCPRAPVAWCVHGHHAITAACLPLGVAAGWLPGCF